MSINLRCDNRILTKDAKFSYLLNNYSSNTFVLYASNTDNIYHNSYVLVGNVGSDNTEILQVNMVNEIVSGTNKVYTAGALTFINFSGICQAGTGANDIYLSSPHTFYPGQTVTVFNNATGAIRGTGTISATGGSVHSNHIVLDGAGVTGAVVNDAFVVNDYCKFAHPESTRITVIPYNQVQFFRTDTPAVPNTVSKTSTTQNQNKSVTQTTTSNITNPPTTTYTKSDDPSFVTTVDYTPPIVFDGAVNLTAPIDIQVNDFYTTFYDTINNDGYGWFAFYNSTTLSYSPISNPIPYAGFPQNTVKTVFEAFDSSLNTKELKLITRTDRFNWLNEGLSYLVNELNLGNWEYYSSEELKLNVKSGQDKYLLPQDFSDLLYINDALDNKIESYSATFQKSRNELYMRYLIRGRYLVFSPVPDRDQTVTLAYLKSAPFLTNLDDVVDLPNNAYMFVKDYMRYRAYQKLGNPSESTSALGMFKMQIDNMKIHAIKRDDGLDSWSIFESSNV